MEIERRKKKLSFASLVHREMPGELQKIKEWFRDYKVRPRMSLALRGFLWWYTLCRVVMHERMLSFSWCTSQ